MSHFGLEKLMIRVVEMVTGVVRQFRDGLRQTFNKAKESIIYETITRTRDADDNPIETAEISTTDAVVQILRLEDIQEIGGLLQVGDAVAFFDHNTTVRKQDRIVHQGIPYRITAMNPERVKGSLIFTEAYCKREEYIVTKIKTLSETLSISDSVSEIKNP